MKGKYCWLAKQEKKGWRLYFCLGNTLTFPVKGLVIVDEKDVKRALKGSIVFVHMRGKK